MQGLQELSNSDFTTYKVTDARDYQSRSNQLNMTSGLVGKNLNFKPQLLLGYQLTDRGYDQPAVIDEKYFSSSLVLRNQYQLIDEQNRQWLLGIDYHHENFEYQSFGKNITQSQGEQKGLFTQANTQIEKDTLLEAGLRSEKTPSRKRPCRDLSVGFDFLAEFEIAMGHWI